MSTTLVNLTLPAVTQEIETVLETYPDHPHQQAFAHPQLRERLLAYVLSQIDCKFTVAEAGETLQIPSEILFASPDHQAYVDGVIHQGIHRLLNEAGDWVNRHIPAQEGRQGEAPSHWFG